jgi:hypothetical protein
MLDMCSCLLISSVTELRLAVTTRVFDKNSRRYAIHQQLPRSSAFEVISIRQDQEGTFQPLLPHAFQMPSHVRTFVLLSILENRFF